MCDKKWWLSAIVELLLQPKKSMRFFVLFLFAIGCSSASQEQYDTYGETITSDNALQVDSFLQQVSTTSESYKVEGTIEEVCQMKGCWMTLKNETGSTIRVTFKDYAFFVPTDSAGKTVVLEGVLTRRTVSEAQRAHYAEDLGEESVAEGAAQEYAIEATSVLLPRGLRI